jgi:hypothetical protein
MVDMCSSEAADALRTYIFDGFVRLPFFFSTIQTHVRIGVAVLPDCSHSAVSREAAPLVSGSRPVPHLWHLQKQQKVF